MLFVTAEIEKIADNLYMGWAHDYKALVVQGTSQDDVKKELLISLRAKVAYDTNLSITKVSCEEVTKENITKYFQLINKKNKNQFKVQLV